MKRTAIKVLAGISLLIPIDAEAQRDRARKARNFGHPAPAMSARLANCRAPAGGAAFVCRNDRNADLVYRYAGNTRNRERRAWVPARWGRVYLAPVGRRALRGEIRQGVLRDMLGRETVRHVRDLGRRQGLRGKLRGHYFESYRFGAVLTVSIGGRDFVEFVDFNLDGIVDDVFVRNTRRW